MTQNKTLSTRVSTDIYNLFVDSCDKDSMSVSQCLKQIVTDLALQHKEEKDSLECSIESETEKISTTTPTFSQNNKFEKELKYLQDKNIQNIDIQKMEMKFAEYIDQLNNTVKELKTKIDGKQNKPLSCFTEEDRINSHFGI